MNCHPGELRVDEEEVAERGGGRRRRSLPVGLPDSVGGGDGGRDAPAHPVAVPQGLPGAEDLLGVPLRFAREERRPAVRLVGAVQVLPLAPRLAPPLLRRGDLRPAVPGDLPALMGSKVPFICLFCTLYLFSVTPGHFPLNFSRKTLYIMYGWNWKVRDAEMTSLTFRP